jgi:hypothetical protein
MPEALLAAPDYVRVIRQTGRLGWIGNVNFLLGQIESPYVIVVGHDDRLSPDYIERAVETLERREDVSVVHGTMRHHGVNDGVLMEAEGIEGTRFQRLTECLHRGVHRGLAWRGVARSEAISHGLCLRTRKSNGLFANHIWELELLVHGGSASVDGIFYDKFTDPTGLSRSYHALSSDQVSQSLADNVVALIDMVSQHGFSASEREIIVAAYVDSMLGLGGAWDFLSAGPSSAQLPFTEVRAPLSQFLARVAIGLTEPAKGSQVLDPPDV